MFHKSLHAFCSSRVFFNRFLLSFGPGEGSDPLIQVFYFWFPRSTVVEPDQNECVDVDKYQDGSLATLELRDADAICVRGQSKDLTTLLATAVFSFF